MEEIEIKTYWKYCKEWVLGCLTSYVRVKWKKLLKEIVEGLRSALVILVCFIVPLLFILFPIGAFLLRWNDKKQNEHIRNVRDRWQNRITRKRNI